jgi:hypothetical protein
MNSRQIVIGGLSHQTYPYLLFARPKGHSFFGVQLFDRSGKQNESFGYINMSAQGRREIGNEAAHLARGE